MFSADDSFGLISKFGSSLDLKAVGTFRYVADASTRAIVLAYAVGDAPALTWHADGAILDWDNAPDDLRAAFDRGATLAAWNASFDSRHLELRHARISLPRAGARHRCDGAGRRLQPADRSRKRLARPRRRGQAEGRQEADQAVLRRGRGAPRASRGMAALSHYARQDVEAMRDVYRRTRPLPLEEWQQYWAFEHINRRGVVLDMPFVRRAAALAAEDAVAIGRRLVELTDGAVTRVTQAKRIAAWLHDQLADAAMREVLTVGVPRTTTTMTTMTTMTKRSRMSSA